MPLEIERKFLIKNDTWKASADKGLVIKQAYLNTDKERTVRVRLKDEQGFLTIKGKTVNTTRVEFEYEIPKQDALELLKLCSKSVIEKTRYNVLHENMLWEIDIFEGDNAGLEVAEIELENENQTFSIPNWLGKEVSMEPKYFNSSLVEKPFKDW